MGVWDLQETSIIAISAYVETQCIAYLIIQGNISRTVANILGN